MRSPSSSGCAQSIQKELRTLEAGSHNSIHQYRVEKRPVEGACIREIGLCHRGQGMLLASERCSERERETPLHPPANGGRPMRGSPCKRRETSARIPLQAEGDMLVFRSTALLAKRRTFPPHSIHSQLRTHLLPLRLRGGLGWG